MFLEPLTFLAASCHVLAWSGLGLVWCLACLASIDKVDK
jgi:hypothetical protein